jgi:hypothetical protein
MHFKPFRPKQLIRIEQLISADEFDFSFSTPGVARGYYNSSLTGKLNIAN